MQIETGVAEAAASLADPLVARRPLAITLRAAWVLGKLVLTGLLVTYLVGWVQDFQRIRRLTAEPTPPFKIITKYEAWERIYRRPVRVALPPAPSPPQALKGLRTDGGLRSPRPNAPSPGPGSDHRLS